MNSKLNISQTDPRPMYLQIMEQVKQRIAVGDWQPGAEIPSIRALAVDTKVSVITIKRAYLELERDGVIFTRQGKGSFVSDNVDLSTQLHEQELNEYLAAAARLGTQLGKSTKEITEQLKQHLDKIDQDQP